MEVEGSTGHSDLDKCSLDGDSVEGSEHVGGCR